MMINLPQGKEYYIKHSKDEHPTESDFSMHAHSHYEILVFISGDISYLVEGNIYRPEPWDILIFNIAETHKVNVHSNKPYERMVIQMDKNIFGELLPHGDLFYPFQKRELGRDNTLRAEDFGDDLWKRTLTRMIEKKDLDRFETLSYVLSLLCEIKLAFNKRIKHSPSDSLASHIVQYTNEHITDKLTAEDIARHFFISRTALYSIFRENTGTGIHDYINVKRLIMAQEMLKRGIKATEVAQRCGFSDYSTFFRAYKARFEISPSEEIYLSCPNSHSSSPQS